MKWVFRSLKTELVPVSGYRDLAHAKRDVASYLMDYYNRKRPHSYNGYLPPMLSEELLKQTILESLIFQPSNEDLKKNITLYAQYENDFSVTLIISSYMAQLINFRLLYNIKMRFSCL
ncbi:TPA: transposase [Vibrio vulnificus]|nr:transposase [Vibrio vulnificus]HDY8158669.1 transposase [Vibrio vulnificus]